MKAIGKHLADVEEGMSLLDQGEVERMADVLREVRKMGGSVWMVGNGGSNATGAHFANDLVKVCRVKAHNVGDRVELVTAYGNDTGWENMFAGGMGVLGGMGGAGDCVVGISCSGNSENVLQALTWAQGKGMLTVGLTGMSEGSDIHRIGLDVLVHARGRDIRVVEDLHMMVCHAVIRTLVEEG